MTMFKEAVAKDGRKPGRVLRRFAEGGCREAERLFTAYLEKPSAFGILLCEKLPGENFYHGILLGILGFKSGWYVRSNEESGEGLERYPGQAGE